MSPELAAVMSRELHDLLHRQDHVLSRDQALRHFTAPMIERRLAVGRWQSPHRAVYVTHAGPVLRRAHLWIAVLGTLAGRQAWLGGLTSLELSGFRGFDDTQIHVLLPDRGFAPRRVPTGVVAHRTIVPAGFDPQPDGRPPSTAPARSLVDAAQWQPSSRRAWAIVSAGLQQRLTHIDAIRSVLSALPRARHHAAMTEALDCAAGGAQSLPEADFLRLCRRAGLPTPVLQQTRRDATGRRRYLDAYFPEHRLHIEVDGSHHMDVQQWWADMRRQNALWLPGDRVLRFPAWAIRHHPEDVISQLKAALSHSPPH
ncbi:endonuclease domain-containing protein [Actinoplanes rectilineatus]|uniref:endonuclease domain-containing protein n=1 Tax=Actinoplanes rectilineatus TaxID=113571 RepID=UPI0005F2E3EA|nr:DUF559 domain-containing protein [Actinoplanes rectilineatus]